MELKKIQEITNPSLRLCNPNQKELCEIIPETATVTLRLNDISELNITVNKYTAGNNTIGKIEQPCYNLLESKRLIKVEDIGWFEINNVSESDGEGGTIKTIVAQSHQRTLRDKGFYVYDSVYKFYNSEDPYDDLFDARKLEPIPSVCGQLCKQLDIKLDLSDEESAADKKIALQKDYGEWTIVYIDKDLRFKEDEQGDLVNMYRTLQSETTNGYDFMVNTVEKAFEIIWLFDFLTHSIKVKYISSITQPTNIYLSYDNLVQNIETTENADNIVTVLNCNGGNGLDISSVNPMGTNYIVNFDYYKNTEWMSEELITLLDKWKIAYEGKADEFSGLVKSLQDNYAEMSEYEDDIQYEELKIKSLTDGRDLCITNSPVKLESVKIWETSKCSTSTFYEIKFSCDYEMTKYYKNPFEYTNDKFEGKGDYREDIDGEWCFNKGYCYFSDGDKNSYCKLISLEGSDDVWGFERYGICPSGTDTIYDIDEDSDIMTAVETVNAGETSLHEDSVFFETPFNGNANCYMALSVAPRDDKLWFTSDEYIEGTFNECAEKGYYYFTDARSVKDGQYCKMNMASKIDPTTKQETYYVSGFTRYVILNKVSDWIARHESKLSELTDLKQDCQNRIDSVSENMDSIANECNVQKYVKNNDTTEDKPLYKEFQAYWSEGDYTNDTYAMTDSMTIADSIDLSKQLKEVGEAQLKKVSQPKFSFSISSLDFLRLKEFQTFAKQLELGKVISVEKKDGVIYSPAITEISFNLLKGEDFSLTMSNSAKLNGNEFTFADLVAESSSVSKSVSSNWQDLLSYAKEKEKISSLIANPLDRALRAGMGGAINQEFIVDDTGILGRKYTDDAHTSFSSEQLRMINNLILFTDNNWESAKTALGKIYYTDDGEEKSAYGLVAQTIIGDLIMSNTLKIKNSENDSESTILLNKDGITIKGSDDTLLFQADTSGNVSITGQINATSGYIGDEINGFLINKDSISHSLDTNAERVLISTGSLDSYSVSNSGNMTGWMLLAGSNFGVTKTGELYANEGKIANISIGHLGIYNDSFILSDGFYTSSGNRITVLGIGSWEKKEFSASTILTDGGVCCPTVHATSLLASDSVRGDILQADTGIVVSDAYNNDGRIMKLTQGVIKCLNTGFTLGKHSSTLGTETVQLKVVYSAHEKTLGVQTVGNKALRWNKTIYIKCKFEGASCAKHEVEVVSVTIPQGGTEAYYDCYWRLSDYVPTISLTNTGVESAEGWASTLEYAEPVVTDETEGWYIGVEGSLIPQNGGKLGKRGQVWDAVYADMVYADSCSCCSSDRNIKNTICSIAKDKRYSELFDRLDPVSYKLNNGASDRSHLGLIAQDLKTAIIDSGFTTKEIASYCEWEANESDGRCGIRYSELIPLNISEIQKLKKRVTELEQKLNKYTNKEGE